MTTTQKPADIVRAFLTAKTVADGAELFRAYRDSDGPAAMVTYDNGGRAALPREGRVLVLNPTTGCLLIEKTGTGGKGFYIHRSRISQVYSPVEDQTCACGSTKPATAEFCPRCEGFYLHDCCDI